MALFHLSVTQTKRSAGQSAIASAAYRAGERLYSEYYGEYSDYTRKGGVICSDILLPSHAPKEYADRQTLWNAVEKAERGKTATTWFETAFVVFVATYLAYIMMMTGQKLLRPTIVSMYNYVQPIVACIVSVATGLGVFGWSQGAAVLLVFGGVWLVTQSKSRADLKTEHPSHTDPES